MQDFYISAVCDLFCRHVWLVQDAARSVCDVKSEADLEHGPVLFCREHKPYGPVLFCRVHKPWAADIDKKCYSICIFVSSAWNVRSFYERYVIWLTKHTS